MQLFTSTLNILQSDSVHLIIESESVSTYTVMHKNGYGLAQT